MTIPRPHGVVARELRPVKPLVNEREAEGFEPPVAFTTLAFKASAFGRSATLPGVDLIGSAGLVADDPLHALEHGGDDGELVGAHQVDEVAADVLDVCGDGGFQPTKAFGGELLPARPGRRRYS